MELSLFFALNNYLLIQQFHFDDVVQVDFGLSKKAESHSLVEPILRQKLSKKSPTLTKICKNFAWNESKIVHIDGNLQIFAENSIIPLNEIPVYAHAIENECFRVSGLSSWLLKIFQTNFAEKVCVWTVTL